METLFLLILFFSIFCQDCLKKIFHLGLSHSASKPVDLLNPIKILHDRETGNKIVVSQLLHKSHILHPVARCRTQQHWQKDLEQYHHL